MYVKQILLIFFVVLGNSLSEYVKKKQGSENDFQPSKEWKEIKQGQKVPAGLHYRINLSTGKKEAKILDKDETEDDNTNGKKSFILKKDRDENKHIDTVNTDEIESLLKEVNKKNPEDDMPKKFRTLDEIKKELGDLKFQPKSDIEILKDLFKKFEAQQKKKQVDNIVILDILQNFKYLCHQIDNGNEFYKLDGFRKIIYKELNSTNTAIKQESLKLFSVLAQNNPKVKVHILETGGITMLLRVLSLESNSNVRYSALTALSCSLRTFPFAQNKFVEIGGLNIFTELFKTESIKMKLKIVTLLNDLIMERQNDREHFEQYEFIDIEKTLYSLNWCSHLNQLMHDVILIDVSDFDSIEKCLLAMKSMLNKCKGLYNSDIISKLHDQFSLAAKDNDYFEYLSGLTSTLIDDSSGSDKIKDEL